jgi:hypothetical protein
MAYKQSDLTHNSLLVGDNVRNKILKCGTTGAETKTLIFNFTYQFFLLIDEKIHVPIWLSFNESLDNNTYLEEN